MASTRLRAVEALGSLPAMARREALHTALNDSSAAIRHAAVLQVRRDTLALAEMQDCLGSMNDAVVGHDLVQELTQDDDAFARATDMLAGWHAARIEGDMPRAADISRKIARIDRFWEIA